MRCKKCRSVLHRLTRFLQVDLMIPRLSRVKSSSTCCRCSRSCPNSTILRKKRGAVPIVYISPFCVIHRNIPSVLLVSSSVEFRCSSWWVMMFCSGGGGEVGEWRSLNTGIDFHGRQKQAKPTTTTHICHLLPPPPPHPPVVFSCLSAS